MEQRRLSQGILGGRFGFGEAQGTEQNGPLSAAAELDWK